MEEQILTVSQLNQYIKTRMEADPLLNRVYVQGELSNYKVYPSGHHYFTLKDNGGALRCVMFRSSACHLRFRPENGMAVLAAGRVAVYPRDGAYQLYCDRLNAVGIGDLYVAFAQLKEKLAAEGLFAPSHKKPLPRFPHRIVIITSAAGAAIHDMLRILGKRYPLSKVVLLPVRVQGTEAPGEICAAIAYANEHALGDVLIVGRGGGSMEDLWCFNDEQVARAIYASAIPVVSGVGHEPDVTISDYVADLRAATPSNAAELIAPDQAELRSWIDRMQQAMSRALEQQLKAQRQRLEQLSGARMLQSPIHYVQHKRQQLEAARGRLTHATVTTIGQKKQRFVRLSAGLEAMSPLKVLSRGYSLVLNEKAQVVRSVKQVAEGDAITIQAQDGAISATVKAIREDHHA